MSSVLLFPFLRYTICLYTSVFRSLCLYVRLFNSSSVFSYSATVNIHISVSVPMCLALFLYASVSVAAHVQSQGCIRCYSARSICGIYMLMRRSSSSRKSS